MIDSRPTAHRWCTKTYVTQGKEGKEYGRELIESRGSKEETQVDTSLDARQLLLIEPLAVHRRPICKVDQLQHCASAVELHHAHAPVNAAHYQRPVLCPPE